MPNQHLVGAARGRLVDVGDPARSPRSGTIKDLSASQRRRLRGRMLPIPSPHARIAGASKRGVLFDALRDMHCDRMSKKEPREGAD